MFWMSVVSAFDWRGALERAQTKAGLKDDTVAALMGITRQRWAQMREGAANRSWDHLSLLAHDRDGYVMLRAFHAEWAVFHGISDLELVGEFLRNAQQDYTRLRMRMAKAQLPERAEIKRTA